MGSNWQQPALPSSSGPDFRVLLFLAEPFRTSGIFSFHEFTTAISIDFNDSKSIRFHNSDFNVLWVGFNWSCSLSYSVFFECFNRYRFFGTVRHLSFISFTRVARSSSASFLFASVSHADCRSSENKALLLLETHPFDCTGSSV